MTTFTNQEYADILFVYGFCDGNARAAVAEYHRRFPNRRLPSKRVFSRAYLSIRESGSVPNRKIERTPRRRTNELENEVIATIEGSPTSSIRRISARLETPQTTVWRIVHDFGLYPFHLQRVQALQPNDYFAREEFSQWILRNQELCNKILFTDEACFGRDGITNMRNSHVWSPMEENPHATYETHFQTRFSVNVWCGIIGNHLVGPFVLEHRLTGQLYLNFLQETLPLLLEDIPLDVRQGMWFQQDGAPPHFYREVTTFLNEIFPNRWIGRGGPVHWCPRSPDLTPLDYFLWGYMKAQVYSVRINTREELIARIMEVANQIRNVPDILLRSIMSIVRRAQLCIDNGGGHFESQLH